MSGDPIHPEGIYVCEGCGRTYPEYINGCVEDHGSPRKVVLAAGDEAVVETPTPVVTRYQSYCSECDQVIYPGDLIAWFPMCTRPAVHRDCYVP